MLSEAVVSLFRQGKSDPTKIDILDVAIQNTISEGSPQIVRDVLCVEFGNLLENYFKEVCASAAEEIGCPYHYTSKKWYASGSFMPKSEEEARAFIVVFGNGRTGKAAGVRFVKEEDEPDPMLLVALSKDIGVINSAISTRIKKVEKAIESGAIGAGDAIKLRGMFSSSRDALRLLK